MYDARVHEVLFSAPSDVTDEIEAARRVADEWNRTHGRSKSSLVIIKHWSTDSYPASGKPQEVLNNQLLRNADIVVAVFWARAGTPTCESDSGTLEEIERQIAAGKHVMVYFLDKPINPSKLDMDQAAQVQTIKTRLGESVLYATVATTQEFEKELTRHIALLLSNAQSIETIIANASAPDAKQIARNISRGARDLLTSAVTSTSAHLVVVASSNGYCIYADNLNLVSDQSRREIAKAKRALQELVSSELVDDENSSGTCFEITALGYEVYDKLPSLV